MFPRTRRLRCAAALAGCIAAAPVVMAKPSSNAPTVLLVQPENTAAPAWQEPQPLPGSDPSSQLAQAPNPVMPPAEPSVQTVEPVVEAAVSPVPETATLTVSGRKWKIYTTFEVSGTYDDNILISDRNKQSDYYFTAAAGLAFGWGDYKSRVAPFGDDYGHRYGISREDIDNEKDNYTFASYTPSWTQFVQHRSESSFNHDLLLDSEWHFSKLSLGLNSHFLSANEPNVDVGGRVRHDLLSAALNAHYDLSDKTSAEVSLSDTNNTYPTQLDSNELVEANWLGYQIAPKTNIGAGVALGYLTVQDSPDQTYEQALLRATWLPTEKLSFRINGGAEFRQTNSDSGDRIGGVFGAGLDYQIFDGTMISLDAYRRTENSSVIAGENYTVTSVGARISQRLFQRVRATLLTGYSESVYDAVPNSQFPQRRDDFAYVQPSIAFDFTKWSSIELGYQYRQNNSTLSDPTFHQNIATTHVSILF